MKANRRVFLAGAGATLAAPYISKFGIGRARANTPIRIGGQGALSGAFADYGRMIEMGATMAIEEINEAGGINGRMLELNFRDEELRPDVAVRNARTLVDDWGADFLVGVDSSGSAMGLGSILPDLDRICIFTHAGTHRLTEELVAEQGIQQIFRSSVPVYQDAILAAQMFAQREDIKTWANIGADYEYGHVNWTLFKQTLKELRPDVEFVAEAWAPFQTLDFGGHVSSVMAERPDAVYATPWGGEAITLLRTAQQMGAFASVKAWWQAMGGSVDVLESLQGNLPAFEDKLYATGRYLFTWAPEETRDLNDAFVANFRERFDRFPNYSAETTYSAVMAIRQAVEDAGSTETAEVVQAMSGMRLMSPGGHRHFRAEDHQAVYPVPAGRIVQTDDYPFPTVSGDLFVVDPEDYYRWPPFEPVET